MIKNKYFLIPIMLMFLILNGCRGWKTEKPPVHPNINFDFQPKIKAQTNPLVIPKNTIIYKSDNRQKSLRNLDITYDFVKNGQKNYNIHCAACHTRTGNGTKSIISQNGWVVSNILEDTTYQKSNEELYSIVDIGIRSMPGYGKKLSSEEMWEIVMYVRSLQKISRVTESEKKLIQRNINER